ncbi:hypothetical protein GCM10027612_52360 [Microbispora bryophytorum subsp. camponoti]
MGGSQMSGFTDNRLTYSSNVTTHSDQEGRAQLHRHGAIRGGQGECPVHYAGRSKAIKGIMC